MGRHPATPPEYPIPPAMPVGPHHQIRSQISARACLHDRLICSIRLGKSLTAYTKAFDCLNRIIDQVPQYNKFRRTPPLPAFIGTAGAGVDFVRRVRNQFAHGAAKFPQPNDWGEDAKTKPSTDQVIVGHCTLITLFTIQMLLREYFAGKTFDVRSPDGEETDIHDVLETLHLGDADTGH